MTHHLLEDIYYRSPVPLQNALISGYRYYRRPQEYGRSFRRFRELLDGSQWWSRGELEAWQFERLRCLVKHAYDNVPAYRAMYEAAGVHPADVRSLDDITKLPTVTKQQIRDRPEAFRARNSSRYRPVSLNTSGTTGSPFRFFSDRETEAIEWALVWRHKNWGGARLWAPIISLGGRLIVPLSQRRPPYWRFNRAEGTMWFSAFHMTPENLDLYVDAMEQSGIPFMKGYPSNLSILAQHLKNRGKKLPLQSVFSGSEPLFDHIRELVEDRFECKVYDWYGVSERVVTASQCGRHHDYHVHMENCLVEVLSREEPVSYGRHGEVVSTCLSNYAMPFIRYHTGDVSALSNVPCSCGRGLVTMTQVQTKWEHILTTADGRWISPSVLTHAFKPIQGVEKSQIVQETPGHITIKVVTTPLFDHRQQEALAHGFQERLGDDVSIEIVRVEDIARDPSGKYRWVISKVPSDVNRWLA